MASNNSSIKITSALPQKLAVYGLGQFGFAMTELFSVKHPSIPVEAYDPVTVRYSTTTNTGSATLGTLGGHSYRRSAPEK